MKRRAFLKAGLAAGTFSLVTSKDRLFGQNGPFLTKYVDPLPIPDVLRPGAGTLHVKMTEFTQKLHRNMAPTRLWGYNGTYPGPTIEAQKGSPVSIQWENNLPPVHFLPIDHKLHGASMDTPEVRTVVHLHGIRVLPDSDGYSEAWFTPGYKQVGPFFKNKTYTYPNQQPATSLWYHDHALGITRLNVYAGLAGNYILRDELEASLNLPSGDYEVPLLIQDRLFNGDGSLLYPVELNGTQEFWIPEFFGDTVLVNGMVWPHLDVEPRKYRFRMLNGSNARLYHMTLQESNSAGGLLGAAGPAFYQIGTDGGLLSAPVKLNELLMAPAERFDIIIDFSGQAGKNFVLTNDGPAPFPGGGEVVPTEIMQFRVVKPLSGKDTSRIPDVLAPKISFTDVDAVRERNLELSELDRASDGYPIIGKLDGLGWSDPVTENPKAGTTEIWNLVNTTGDAHPIHVHLVEFHVLGRQRFSQNIWDAQNRLVYTGNLQAPAANEVLARKDTVIAFPNMVTKIVAKFDLPPGTPVAPGDRFRYMWHCHILEHEDNEMMRPYDVIG
jgi:spore coat protein A, manganese oxidase